jgi:hypothetical protein
VTNTDIQRLLDESVATLKTTTVGYSGHSAAWRANQTTAWWKGLDKIGQARAALDPVVVPTPPPPPPPVSGAYKTRFTNIAAQPFGDDASFGGAFYQQEKTPDRANITLLAGEKVLRTRCAVGDSNVAGSGSGERCELMTRTPELVLSEGKSLIVGTQFCLDPSFSAPGFQYGTDYWAWSQFVQFHHEGSGQVPFQLSLCTDSARLGMRIIGGGSGAGPYNPDTTPVGSTTEWWWTKTGPPNQGGNSAATVTKGVWHKLVLSLKFSQASGYARVWLNGGLCLDVTGKKIGYADDTGYWKQGFYRSNGAPGDSTIYWRDLFSFISEADALAF